MVTPTQLIPGIVLTESEQTCYTCPESTRAMIRQLTLTNTSTSDRTVTIYLVPARRAPGEDCILVKDFTAKAHDTTPVRAAVGHMIEPGGRIVAAASGALTMIGSGVEIS